MGEKNVAEYAGKDRVLHEFSGGLKWSGGSIEELESGGGEWKWYTHPCLLNLHLDRMNEKIQDGDRREFTHEINSTDSDDEVPSLDADRVTLEKMNVLTGIQQKRLPSGFPLSRE